MGGAVFLFVEKELAFVGGKEVEEFGPVAAVVDVEEGLGLVARGDPDVEAGLGCARFEHGVESIGFWWHRSGGIFPRCAGWSGPGSSEVGRGRARRGRGRRFRCRLV